MDTPIGSLGCEYTLSQTKEPVLCVPVSYPEHLVEVVVLLTSGVEQEGPREEPAV